MIFLYLVLSLLAGVVSLRYASSLGEHWVDGFLVGFFCWPMILCFFAVYVLLLMFSLMMAFLFGDA